MTRSRSGRLRNVGLFIPGELSHSKAAASLTDRAQGDRVQGGRYPSVDAFETAGAYGSMANHIQHEDIVVDTFHIPAGTNATMFPIPSRGPSSMGESGSCDAAGLPILLGFSLVLCPETTLMLADGKRARTRQSARSVCGWTQSKVDGR